MKVYLGYLVILTAVILFAAYRESQPIICDSGTEVELTDENTYPAWSYTCGDRIVIIVD